MKGGAWPLYATTSPKGLSCYEGNGVRTPLPDLVDRSCGPTEEILRLLRAVASTQAENQHAVLERLDRLDGRLEAGLVASSPRGPARGVLREPLRERAAPLGPAGRARQDRRTLSWKRAGSLRSESSRPEKADGAPEEDEEEDRWHAGDARVSLDGPKMSYARGTEISNAGDGPKLSYARGTQISMAASAEGASTQIRGTGLSASSTTRGTEITNRGTEISGMTDSPRDSHERPQMTHQRTQRSEARSAQEAAGPRRSFWAIGRTNRNVFMNRLGRHQTMDLEPEGEQSLRQRCFSVLAHPTFDVVIGVVIMLNSVVIGVELTVQPSEENETPESRLWFGIFEHLFLSIYLVELAVRLYACGKSCLQNPWVRFDFFLVVLGVIGAWLVPLIILVAGDALREFLPAPMFLRILRLARVARALRLFIQFRTLWMLVSGLSSSLSAIFNVFIVLLLVLFVFACLGVELITNNDQLNHTSQALVQKHFHSLPMIMMTLVQFVILDDIGEIYTPMIKDDLWLVFFFFPFLLVVSIILMNVVTAVVIEVFLEQGKRDQETRRLWNNQRIQQLMPELKTMFHALDTDDSGSVTLDELTSAQKDVQRDLEALMNVDSLLDLFEALDVDGSMEVSIEEFLDGMLRLICSNHSIDMTRVLKLLRLVRQDLEELKYFFEVKFARATFWNPAASAAMNKETTMGPADSRVTFLPDVDEEEEAPASS